MTGEHANPGTTITVSCSAENGAGINAFQWLVNGDLGTNINDGAPVSQVFGANNFTSNVIYYNESIQTNVSLSFTAVSSLDNTVITCRDGPGNSDSCTLKIKSQLY